MLMSRFRRPGFLEPDGGVLGVIQVVTVQVVTVQVVSVQVVTVLLAVTVHVRHRVTLMAMMAVGNGCTACPPLPCIFPATIHVDLDSATTPRCTMRLRREKLPRQSY